MTTYGGTQRKVRENVLTLLEEIPETRNSDKLLMLKYWQRFDGINTNRRFGPQFITSATSPESITRARRSIQSGGLFLPTEEEVLRRRHMLQEEAREYHATNR